MWLFVWFCFYFPGIHLKPGINTFFVFPKGISSHKSISEQCRIYFRVFGGALKTSIKQLFLWCCYSKVLFFPPFPQHSYIFLIPLSFLLHMHSSLLTGISLLCRVFLLCFETCDSQQLDPTGRIGNPEGQIFTPSTYQSIFMVKMEFSPWKTLLQIKLSPYHISIVHFESSKLSLFSHRAWRTDWIWTVTEQKKRFIGYDIKDLLIFNNFLGIILRVLA